MRQIQSLLVLGGLREVGVLDGFDRMRTVHQVSLDHIGTILGSRQFRVSKVEEVWLLATSFSSLGLWC